jgi:hypothetical protein
MSGRRIRGGIARTCLLALTAAQLVPLQPAYAAGTLNAFSRELALELGFTEGDLPKIESGEIVSRKFGKEDEKELAVVMGVLLPVPAAEIARQFKLIDPLSADATIHAWGRLEGAVTAGSFAALELPQAELEKLAGSSVDDEFNLSQQELAQLERGLAGKKGKDREAAAMQVYREILAGRVGAYQSRGLAGIAPYRHGGDESTPRLDLEGALPVKTGAIARQAPEFYRWLSEYPAAGSASNSEFRWQLQEFNGRPAVVLAHRAVHEAEDIVFMSSRNFYVGHTFDVLQILSGVVPSGPDSGVLFYVNRTFTEQVTGFGSGAAHGIGRKIMQGEIRALFESVREVLAKIAAGS